MPIGLDRVQVPLGTVVHRVLPQAAEVAEEGVDLAKGPPRLQMHWIGARDYVSSDDEGSASGEVLPDQCNKRRPTPAW